MASHDHTTDYIDGVATDPTALDPAESPITSAAVAAAAAAATVAAASSSASGSHIPPAPAPAPDPSADGAPLPPLGLQGGHQATTYYFSNEDPSAGLGAESSYQTGINGASDSPGQHPGISLPDEDEEMSQNHHHLDNIDASDPGGIGPMRHHHHHHHHHDHDAEATAALLDPGTAAAVAAAAAAAAASSSSPSSSSLAPPHSSFKKETPYSRSPELRVSHKLAERKRRREMKDLFDDLRDQLPVERGPKTSKWEILSKATEHIQTLSRQRDELVRELTAFRSGNVSISTAQQPQQAQSQQPTPVPAHAPAPGATESAPVADPSDFSYKGMEADAASIEANGSEVGRGGGGGRGRRR
ncbi:hypothetical protein CF327_g4457 [Tilletia walkeri]|uniref:BHLH domain-containing protein n=1 Tax=Tilletia walkeri TaxID=117179 RepID=A0A8X7N9I6_9BASI|nr:hypothetical protein CF327_g4457 [Tilletia walkeri]KAE8269746.1 hypothetical protein A4X09_0g2604 [Tilletia walkeri]